MLMYYSIKSVSIYSFEKAIRVHRSGADIPGSEIFLSFGFFQKRNFEVIGLPKNYPGSLHEGV